MGDRYGVEHIQRERFMTRVENRLEDMGRELACGLDMLSRRMGALQQEDTYAALCLYRRQLRMAIAAKEIAGRGR